MSPHGVGGVEESMGLLEVLAWAYGATGFISLAGYIPQFRAYITNRRACEDAPVATWALWSFQSMIVVTYAGVLNGDAMFILSGCLGGAANTLGLLLIVWGRARRGKDGKSGGVVVAFPTPPRPRPAKGGRVAA
ncbi:MAG: hypothetical protein H6922_02995 [Pseudomonadaceae bacterium]|nr:hypothetical protein [Pseudomonadaceae bacterium]